MRRFFWKRPIRLPADAHPVSHAERLIAMAGGFVGILAVGLISGPLLGFHDAALVAASMGASAVLLFAVPHGSLSQPWAVIGGHLVSAAVGVACAKLIDTPYLAAPLSAALAIGAMYYLRCLHPPGGGTALAAVVGGPAIHSLGWGYLLTPVLLNAAILVVVAILFNLPFAWRRYPHAWTVQATPPSPVGAERMIAHSDLVYALSQIDSFIDVDEDDLLRIYALALGHGEGRNLDGAVTPASRAEGR